MPSDTFVAKFKSQFTMSNNKRVLVTGATGAQGGAVVRLLHERGINVRALLLPQEDATPFTSKGIEVVRGDFGDAESLKSALHNVDAVSLVFPLIYDWELLRSYTRNWLEALRAVPVQRVVFNTSLPLPPSRTGSVAADIKLEMFEQFVAAGWPLVTITPSFYLDNLSAPWSLPVIQQHGVVAYPLPGDAQFAWLSHYNLAQFTFHLLSLPDAIGKVFPIGGTLVSGDEIADRLSHKLGKTIRYVYQGKAEFKQMLLQQYSEEIAEEISSIYGNISLNTEPFKAFYQPALFEEQWGVRLQTTDEWIDGVQWN